MTTIDQSQMPAPDTMVRCADGSVCAAMFYYAAADQRLDRIADECGFDCKIWGMGEDDPLFEAYSEGDGSVVARWDPGQPFGSDWTLALTDDTENGPQALYIRKRS